MSIITQSPQREQEAGEADCGDGDEEYKLGYHCAEGANIGRASAGLYTAVKQDVYRMTMLFEMAKKARLYRHGCEKALGV